MCLCHLRVMKPWEISQTALERLLQLLGNLSQDREGKTIKGRSALVQMLLDPSLSQLAFYSPQLLLEGDSVFALLQNPSPMTDLPCLRIMAFSVKWGSARLNRLAFHGLDPGSAFPEPENLS